MILTDMIDKCKVEQIWRPTNKKSLKKSTVGTKSTRTRITGISNPSFFILSFPSSPSAAAKKQKL